MKTLKKDKSHRPSRIKNLIGKKFNRLIVIGEAGRNKFGHVMWVCACDCGEDAIVSGNNLKRGITKSCGCLFTEVLIRRNWKHGMKNTPEYYSYGAAKGRCENRNNKAYPNYGGRGIKFLFDSFDSFLLATGMKPSAEHTLDRINNDGNYETGNVRWALPQEQVENRRIKRIENFTDMEFAAEAEKRGYVKRSNND